MADTAKCGGDGVFKGKRVIDTLVVTMCPDAARRIPVFGRAEVFPAHGTEPCFVPQLRIAHFALQIMSFPHVLDSGSFCR